MIYRLIFWIPLYPYLLLPFFLDVVDQLNLVYIPPFPKEKNLSVHWEKFPSIDIKPHQYDGYPLSAL